MTAAIGVGILPGDSTGEVDDGPDHDAQAVSREGDVRTIGAQLDCGTTVQKSPEPVDAAVQGEGAEAGPRGKHRTDPDPPQQAVQPSVPVRAERAGSDPDPPRGV